MEIKTYSSFDQINVDLEILKLEKELNYHKMTLSFEKTKGNLQIHYIKREVIRFVKEKISESYKKLLMIVIPYVVNFLKRKRGD
jgi:hypothetical protein